ncbi:sulfatase-like hydrolase/transferase [Pseudooceanicola sp. 216_PA32_1]|uniref:Sulfatase-like hydrolase/transferase n=1 Tax=Pseudooceanicola pacificus TaxID=2676438 RepID=A0A844W5J5_9RHOB|nr:sulfatase [Pseudooceanicola pacificus]MWB77994.1 sulfatase-like hydrolase/transferase [Pseudooceanicola pacificus]
MRTVFVLFDSLNRTAMGCYGGTQLATPNFDRFARRAMSFDNHYVGSLPCMPARRDMHTGRLNFMHRSWGPLEPFDNSMPEMLRLSGVHSHLISDHFHYFEDGGATYHSRFKTWEFVRGQENDPWVAMVEPPIERFRAQYDTRHYDVPQNAKRLQNQINREFIREEQDFPGPQCFERAFHFLDQNRSADDWFLQLECFDPHEPFHAPKRFHDAFKTDRDGPILDWPHYAPVAERPEEIATIRANYAALVAMCDDYFGKLLDYFDQYDLWKDTCLILTTDHGFLLSEHDWWGKNLTPYYEEISHIPLIVHHPARPQDAGMRTNALTQTPDLMPTILGLHDVARPDEVTGEDIFDLADGRVARDAVAFGMFGGPIGITDGQYSYFRYPENIASEGLGEYTLMPTHLVGFFEPRELKTMTLSNGFDFTKGMPVMRLDALSDARRPPGLDGRKFEAFVSAIYNNHDDPCQLYPLSDDALEHRLAQQINDILDRHDTPPEYYDWMNLKTATRRKIQST